MARISAGVGWRKVVVSEILGATSRPDLRPVHACQRAQIDGADSLHSREAGIAMDGSRCETKLRSGGPG
jgi:hypothetical protein